MTGKDTTTEQQNEQTTSKAARASNRLFTLWNYGNTDSTRHPKSNGKHCALLAMRENRYWVRIWRFETASFCFVNDWQSVSKTREQVIEYYKAKYSDQRFRIDLEPSKQGEQYEIIYTSSNPIQLKLF